jgi:hypothetical protein
MGESQFLTDKMLRQVDKRETGQQSDVVGGDFAFACPTFDTRPQVAQYRGDLLDGDT